MHQPVQIPQPVPSMSASTMHQICTNHASNTHKPYALIKMYQHHQLYTSCMYTNSSTTCLNHVPNMYLNHIPNTIYQYNHQISLAIHHTIICTNIINYTPHVCANSSTTCLNHVPNMYLNQNPSSISSSKSDL
jgi:hypothetical protein